MDNDNIEKNSFKETLTFINQFGFNNDYFLEFLKNEILGNYRKKPSIEMLRDRVKIYSKDNHTYKKIIATKKVLTDKNIKLLNESSITRASSFSQLITELNESHTLVTILLKILVLKRKNSDETMIYEEVIKETYTFNELIKELDFEKKYDVHILNNFNRIRNILAHAPRNMIIEQITPQLLDEIFVIVNDLIPIINSIFEETAETILKILFIRHQKLEEKGIDSVMNAKTAAEKYDIPIKDFLQIIKDSEIPTNEMINSDMRLDSRLINKLLPLINKYIKDSKKRKIIEKINFCADIFLKAEKIVIFKPLEIENTTLKNIDKALNVLYHTVESLQVEKIIILNENNDTNVFKISKEINTVLNKCTEIVYQDDLKQILKRYKNSCIFLNFTNVNLCSVYSIENKRVIELKELPQLKIKLNKKD